MTDYLVGSLVVVAFLVTAAFGERIQKWLHARRLRRHMCHTTCEESRRCKCGCRDGLPGDNAGTHCAVCGAEVLEAELVEDLEEYDGPYSYLDPSSPTARGGEVTDEMPAPRGFTSWGWERDREFRRVYRDWERD